MHGSPPKAKARRQESAAFEAIAIAALCFALVAPLSYILQRLLDYAIAGAPDPLSMLRHARIAFVWRAATAAFFGGLAALVAYALAQRRGDLTSGAVLRVLAGAALAIPSFFVAVAWLFP